MEFPANVYKIEGNIVMFNLVKTTAGLLLYETSVLTCGKSYYVGFSGSILLYDPCYLEF